jgi:hypothetical protein
LANGGAGLAKEIGEVPMLAPHALARFRNGRDLASRLHTSYYISARISEH